MKEISFQECQEINGGKKFLNIIGGALIGGIIEGLYGLITVGPPGLVIGFTHGVIDGAGYAIVAENAIALTETLHPELVD